MANLYEAEFQDARGKGFPARLRAASDADAKAVANAMAAQSNAKWTDLFKITAVTIAAEEPTPNALGTADSGSDIQRKGRLSYETTIGGGYIPVEIPSVKSDYLSKASPTNVTDPLTSGQRATLFLKGGSPAISLHHTKFGLRNHLR